MDFIHIAKRIFKSSSHPYQIHSAAISQGLRGFFRKDNNNCIEFWDFPSNQNWLPHSLVDKNTKSFDLSPIFPYKSSWDFCKKYNCNSTISQWKISFQVSDLKGRKFLELLSNNLNSLELSAIKGSSL